MQEVANLCVDRMLEEKLIASEDREVYFYGIEVLISLGSSLLVSIILGSLFGYLPQTLAFLAAFLPTRCCIGGYHAPTPGKCFLLSMAVFVPSIYFGEQLNPLLSPLLITISIAMIFKLAPAIHPNHPFSEIHMPILAKRARLVGIIEGIAIMVRTFYQPDYASTMSLAFFAACIGLAIPNFVNQ